MTSDIPKVGHMTKTIFSLFSPFLLGNSDSSKFGRSIPRKREADKAMFLPGLKPGSGSKPEWDLHDLSKLPPYQIPLQALCIEKLQKKFFDERITKRD